MYGEELDLAIRLRSAGWNSVLIGASRATHLGGASTGYGSPRQLYLAGFGRGYIVGKYRLLRSRHALRVIATEAIVVGLRLIRSRDTAALRGRLAGYRSGRRQPKAIRPAVGLERRIGFVASLRMRSRRYWSRY
jgi:GT2 family glycosyltransferase